MQKIGRYRIIEKIEEGNYTSVYRVSDNKTELILKIARVGLPEFNEIIRREFQILSQFRHPNIVPVYEYGVSGDNRAFFTLEYINGKPISQSFKGFSEQIIEAMIQIINALGAFHNKGFIHGDLKPEHIIYNEKERKAILIDFGFAGIPTHQIKKYGTFGYVAPEVLKGIGMDQRSDLYSLGVILYEILSGRTFKKPFEPIKTIPQQLNNALLRLLSEEPALRPTALELYEILSALIPEKKFAIPDYEVQIPPTGFVENSEIMEKLLKLKGETVIINGAPGSGKTRLLRELRYKYVFKDYVVLFFTGREDGYLHNFISKSIDFTDLKFEEKEDKFQVYAEITEKLFEYAKNKNVLILIDNLDRLDDYELGLFRFIGHSIQDRNITMIGTANIDQRIKELNFFGVFLRPFSLDEVKILIDKTFFEIKSKDENDVSVFIAWLYKHTGGNPLFIVEIFRALHTQKILYYHTRRWEIDIKALNEIAIPETIEGILQDKFKRLNEEEINILKAFCIADYPLESSIISSVFAPLNDINIEVLKLLGLIKDEYIQGKRFFSLANQIVKNLVEKRFIKDNVKPIVKKITQAIEEIGSDEIYHPLLGRLFMEIGETKMAYRYFRLCAEKSEKINDIKNAVDYYTKALGCEANEDSPDYASILIKLGNLYLLSGDNHNAVEYYNKSIRYNQFRVEALFGIGKAYSVLGDYDNSIRYLKEALEESMEKKCRAGLLNFLAYCYMCLKDFDEGERILKESIDISRKINNPELEAEALYYYATLEWFKGGYDKGIKICLELLVLCKNNGLDKQSAYTANLLSSFYIKTGDIDNGLRYIDMAIRGFGEIKNLNALIPAMINKAMLISNKGDIKEARQILENTLKDSLKTGNKVYQYNCLANIAGIFEGMSNFDKAIEYYNKALEIEPESVYANYALSMVYCKLSEIDKAKSILEQKIEKKEEVLYLIGLGIVYAVLGKIEKAREYIENGIKKMEREGSEVSITREVYLKSSQFYYEIEEHEKALNLAQKAIKNSAKEGYEYRIAGSLIEVNKFRLDLVDRIEIESNLKYLKDKGFLYDYGYLKRLRIESVIDKGIELEKIKDIAEELESVEQVFRTIGAELELQRVKKIQLKLYPVMLRDYSQRLISPQYLDIFSKLAELINSNLGDEDFVAHILDLVINATGAERGAIFIRTEKGMKFIAGRNVDKKTIKDAGELSRTAIKEIDKNKIVFIPNAVDDPRFSVKKSVLLNRIRSILCIPLVVSDNIVGAIYLDSRIVGSIFNEQDRDFLVTISKILASVIEKSILFKDLKSENILLKTNVIGEIGAGYLISKSRKMKKIYQEIEAIAQSDAPVLITGETGTGKGMLARLIHLKSKRREKKFLSINCGAIPETLLESELFGHKKGAFTGAFNDKKGLLEEAEGGTIFLDEISNTSAGFQAKMLEAIEEKVVRRLGETTMRKIDVRFILASNKEIEIEVEEGRFRQDLYYRINVFRIKVPPLRERTIDIPELAKFFLKKYCKEMNKNIFGFENGVIERLKEHHWTGNIRELMNVIERAVTLCKGGVITFDDIGLGKTKKEIIPLKDIEKEAIIEALNATNWNKKKTAKLLGISRRTLYNLLKKYSIKNM